MDRSGPDSDRLDRVPLRPHRFAVAVFFLAMLAIVALAYHRHIARRWPGTATDRGLVDISETDVARHNAPKQPATSPGHRAGARSAGGFHQP